MASRLPSLAVVLERSRLTIPGRGGFERVVVSDDSSCFVIVDLDSSVILSVVSPEDDVCERGVSPSGTDIIDESLLAARLKRGVSFGGDDVTMSTSSANRTVESARLRGSAEAGYSSKLESL